MFHVELKPLPDKTDPTGSRRLRQVLKYALRSCGLKCTGARRVDAAGDEPILTGHGEGLADA